VNIYSQEVNKNTPEKTENMYSSGYRAAVPRVFDHQRNYIPWFTKKQIVQAIDNGESRKSILMRFGLRNQSNINRILKARHLLEDTENSSEVGDLESTTAVDQQSESESDIEVTLDALKLHVSLVQSIVKVLKEKLDEIQIDIDAVENDVIESDDEDEKEADVDDDESDDEADDSDDENSKDDELVQEGSGPRELSESTVKLIDKLVLEFDMLLNTESALQENISKAKVHITHLKRASNQSNGMEAEGEEEQAADNDGDEEDQAADNDGDEEMDDSQESEESDEDGESVY